MKNRISWLELQFKMQVQHVLETWSKIWQPFYFGTIYILAYLSANSTLDNYMNTPIYEPTTFNIDEGTMVQCTQQ